MPSNWSTDQLKEFFESKAIEQDRRIENLERTLNRVDQAVSTMVVKVNTMWTAIGAIGLSMIGMAIKLFFGEH